MTTPVFELRNLDYYFDNKHVLENINIKINQGEFLAIVGPNGAGKSTLLKVILGLLPIQKGEIIVDGKPFKGNKSSLKISYVSQKASAFNAGFPASVKEVVLSGLTKTKKIFQRFNKSDYQKVKKVLERLNISHLINKNIAELSGGQQQRTAAARAFVHKPNIIFADEPTGALDSKSAQDLLNRLEDMNKQFNSTIIMVTHDPSAASFAERVIMLKDGNIHSEIYQGDDSKQDFYQEIIKLQSALGGVTHDV